MESQVPQLSGITRTAPRDQSLTVTSGRVRRKDRDDWTDVHPRVLHAFPPLPFDLLAARAHARLWSELAVAGHDIGAHDRLVAATAITAGWKVATSRPRRRPSQHGQLTRSLPPNCGEPEQQNRHHWAGCGPPVPPRHPRATGPEGPGAAQHAHRQTEPDVLPVAPGKSDSMLTWESFLAFRNMPTELPDLAGTLPRF